MRPFKTILAAGLVLALATGCNKEDSAPDTVANRPAPAPTTNNTNITIDTTAPDKPGVSAALYEDELAKLRADAEALGADRAYEDKYEGYYGKLREIQDMGLARDTAAPTFVLKDATGNEVSLEQLRAGDTKGPVLVYFYRGGWSPTSTAQLKWLASAYPELAKSGAKVVAVTPEQAQYIAETTKANSLPFPVLSDPGGNVAQSYRIGYQPDGTLTTQLQGYGVNLSERNGAGPSWLPVNSLYLLDTNGNVVWRSFDMGNGPGIDFSGAMTELQRIQSSSATRAENSDAADRAAESEQAEDRAEGSDAADRANGSDASTR